MNECFPPAPLYIVTGIVVAMLTAVMAKIEDGEAYTNGEFRLATALLAILFVSFAQLIVVIVSMVFADRCCDSLWLVASHGAVIFPLPFGAVYWYWCRIQKREGIGLE